MMTFFILMSLRVDGWKKTGRDEGENFTFIKFLNVKFSFSFL